MNTIAELEQELANVSLDVCDDIYSVLNKLETGDISLKSAYHRMLLIIIEDLKLNKK